MFRGSERLKQLEKISRQREDLKANGDFTLLMQGSCRHCQTLARGYICQKMPEACGGESHMLEKDAVAENTFI